MWKVCLRDPVVCCVGEEKKSATHGAKAFTVLPRTHGNFPRAIAWYYESSCYCTRIRKYKEKKENILPSVGESTYSTALHTVACPLVRLLPGVRAVPNRSHAQHRYRHRTLISHLLYPFEQPGKISSALSVIRSIETCNR